MNPRVLTEIWIYPVKSLGGLRVPSSRVMPKGLQHDRRWMLIDDKNVAMTQRVYPRMALFKTTKKDSEFQISYKDHALRFPMEGAEGPVLEAQVWNDKVSVREVGRAYSEWFSEWLETTCRLVAFPETNARPVDPEYKVQDDHVSLADAYPLLLIGQASLDDLNKRLAEPVPMNRFRPNLVFAGGTPYEEDQWRDFRVGNNRFVAVKPCARCVLTTVDQKTARAGTEPLATLSTYRKRDGKVLFAQNVIPIDTSEITEGDPILLL